MLVIVQCVVTESMVRRNLQYDRISIMDNNFLSLM